MTSTPEPRLATKVFACMFVVVSHVVLVVCSRAPLDFELSCRGWSGVRIAQWVKIFHPGSWTRQDERDDPPPPHTYREWKEFYVPNLDQEGGQPNNSVWYKRDWATEGYRRVAAVEADHGFNSMSFPDQHSVATQSSALP